MMHCPRCGAPLAAEVDRCPLCNMYRGVGDPAPVTRAWWAIYAASILGVLVVVAIGVALTR
jgi:hypothetical protein